MRPLFLSSVSFPADTFLKPCRGRSGPGPIPPTGQEGEKNSADFRTVCRPALQTTNVVVDYSDNIASRQEPLLFLPHDRVDGY